MIILLLKKIAFAEKDFNAILKWCVIRQGVWGGTSSNPAAVRLTFGLNKDDVKF